MTQTTVLRSNDLEYGSAANSTQVGSGYDVEVKRMSATSAIVNVMTPSQYGDWLMLLEVESHTNLQELAIEIGNNPDFGNNDYVDREDDGWEALADTWDSIAVADGGAIFRCLGQTAE